MGVLRKFDALNKYLPAKRGFKGKYASFKKIKFSRGNCQIDSFETETLYCIYSEWTEWRDPVNKQLFIFCPLAYRKNARRGTVHPGTFLRRALWADSVSPWMNTIASHDHFKTIRIKENLVVNYNELQKHEWKFGRTRNLVQKRSSGECFYSLFQFSQTFKIYVYIFTN